MSTEQKLPILQVLQKTPAISIGDLPMVQEKFIANYNACHKDKAGELMYHRNVVHFKQAITNSPELQKCDPLSLYACFVTAAVNGYSLDPQDSEVYLIPIKNKAYIWRQAGAHVKRLIRTGQIVFAEQAKLVYKGDIFQVENGRVVKHIENFESEEIIAGYVRMVIDDKGGDRFFIYRKSDWEAWRKKSSNSETTIKKGQYGDYKSEALWDGGVEGGQPDASFLRTKLIKHACQEKCWATGSTPAAADTFTGIELDADAKPTELPITPSEVIPEETPEAGNITSDDEAFKADVPVAETISHDDDEF